jgi:hypothetical protein
MQPNAKLVTISNNEKLIKELLDELVLQPRLRAIKWAGITKQTPNIKVGYPGQHLASLITGMEGERTGARGNDLRDGSEVKSCSRVDALDECAEKNCGAAVARMETKCSVCNSASIKRTNDSKWLFTIRSEEELKLLTEGVERIVLLLSDYPNFDEGDFETLKFQALELWTHSLRNKRFVELMRNYYYKIYLAHKKVNPGKTPAPKNFWPYSYQFYMCNPIPVFSCTVTDASSSPKIKIETYVEPTKDRSGLASPLMPAGLLEASELDALYTKANPSDLRKCLAKGARLPARAEWRRLDYKTKVSLFSGISETLRGRLSLRDTDKIAPAKTAYKRRGH